MGFRRNALSMFSRRLPREKITSECLGRGTPDVLAPWLFVLGTVLSMAGRQQPLSHCPEPHQQVVTALWSRSRLLHWPLPDVRPLTQFFCKLSARKRILRKWSSPPTLPPPFLSPPPSLTTRKDKVNAKEMH